MVFDKYINKKEDIYRYYLLLIDKYSSYINLYFFKYIDKNEIIILILLFYILY